MHAAAAWLRRRAENVAAALLAVMFSAFVIQIVFRYFFNLPVGWASELTLVVWLALGATGAFAVERRTRHRSDNEILRVGCRDMHRKLPAERGKPDGIAARFQRNEHAAMGEVGKVLTPEQKTMVRQMVDRSRGDKGRSGDRERGQRRE